jgi:UDP-N-acetylmuramyl pentapeptide phosphotransferase/UDP-N-acetylglucosamine-1-phosphate transferase
MVNFLYVITFLSVIFVARFAFASYYKIAEKYDLVKGYSNRGAHSGKVYTGAGLVLTLIILLIAVALNTIDFIFFEKLSPIIGASILIAVVGFYDDFQELSAIEKYIALAFLIITTIYVGTDTRVDYGIITNLQGFFGINEIGYYPGLIFTCFVYLSIMNAINLIDGIDGYIGIFATIFFFWFFIMFHSDAFFTHSIVSVVFMASMIVFLKHNFSRKEKLFVGDAGSLFLGFWMANFLILFITSSDVASFTNLFSIKLENIPVLAIATLNIPVLDTLRVMLIRTLNGKSMFIADRNHIHHILINKGISHLRTSLILCLINSFNLIIIFLLESSFNSFELTGFYIGISLIWFGVFEYFKKKK